VKDKDVFPSETFEVLTDNAKITDEAGNVKTKSELVKGEIYIYTIQVKAVYIEKDKEVKTFINWYNNYDGGLVYKNEDIKINQAVAIPTAPTRVGYTFKGWIRGIEEDGTTTTLTDLWLTLENDGTYSYTASDGTTKVAEEVAADEMLVGDGTQHHALYAKWEAIDVDYTVEFYYQNDNGEGYTKDDSLTATRQAKTDTTVNATDADKAQTKDNKYKLVDGEPSVLSATVAGDGSTVLKVYFDLNEADYTVEFYYQDEKLEYQKVDSMTDTRTGTISDTVSVTDEDKGQITYEGQTYTLNENESTLSATLEATGTVLTLKFDRVVKAGLTVTKTANKTSGVKEGETITYTIKVENTGNVTVSSLALNDILEGIELGALDKTTIAPGETATATATYVVKQSDVDKGKIDNTVTAKGKDPKNAEVTDDDSETVTTVTAEAQIEVTKTADKTSEAKVNDTITYTITVKNTGNVTVSSLALNDILEGIELGALDKTTIAPGETATATATYVVKQSDVDKGKINNTVTATGKDPKGADVKASDSAEVTTVAADAKLTVEKTADPTSGVKVGDKVTYTVVVTNSGNVTVTGIALSDTLVKLSEAAFDLVPAGTKTINYEYTVTQADVDAGKINNTATATGKDPKGADVKASDSAEVTTVAADAKLTVEKTASPTENVAAEGVITYTVVVTNSGNVTVKGIALSDTLVKLSEEAFDLAPAGTKTITYTYTVTQADVDAGKIDNTATATGKDPKGAVVTASDDATVTTVKSDAKLDVKKTANPESNLKVGDKVTYTVVVTNDGNVTVKDITLEDTLVTLSAEAFTLAPKATKTITYTYIVTQADVDAGEIKNTVTATGKDPKGTEINTSDFAIVTATQEGHLTITKETTSTAAAEDGKYALDETIKYKITVTNDGNLTITDITVTDDLTGEEWTIESLAPKASKEFTTSYKVTEADILAGEVVNVATAKGTSPDPDKPDVPVKPGEDPEPTEDLDTTLTVEKKVTNKPADGKAFKLGETIEYTITVTNEGNVSYKNVVIEDDLTGESKKVAELGVDKSETMSVKYTVTEKDILAGSVTNTATAKADPIPDPKDPENPKTPEGEDKVTTGDKDDPDNPPPIEEKNGHITITKETTSNPANGKTYVKDEEITYKITVKNDGNLTIKNITVTDELTGDEWPIESLKPGASEIYTASHKVTDADVKAGKVVNVATAKGTSPDPDKPDVPVKPGEKEDPTGKDETPIIIPQHTNVKITKIWAKDDNNAYGTRPASITVVLLRDGRPYKQATLTEKDNWTITWWGLPMPHVYTVDELEVDGYTKFITEPKLIDGNNPNGGIEYTIINTLDSLNHDHVAYAVGYPDGTVRPTRNITRAEVATIFFRLLTDAARDRYWSQTNPYTDVDPEAWYNNAISTLSNMGILNGYADGTFRPNVPITRAEMTKIASSFFGTADLSEKVSSFTDVSSGAWYSSFIAAAEELGLVNGYGDGTFLPDNYITRAETFAIVNRTLKRAPHKDHLLPGYAMNVWPDNMDTNAWYYADVQEATNSHDFRWIEDSRRVEQWTAKLPDRDWTALEHAWSDAHGGRRFAIN
jgi:uncharacterized repeat protein (TIGR01451 family)